MTLEHQLSRHRANLKFVPVFLFFLINTTQKVFKITHKKPYNEYITSLYNTRPSGRSPGYLADNFRLAGRGRPGSRSAASMMLDIPRTTTSLGDRAFAVAGPRVWNSLPPAIRDPSLSPSIFGKLLKTYLFV